MKSARGFTLIELLVVITIIAILALIGLAIYSNAQKSARDSKRKSDLFAMSQVLEQYKAKNNTYIPASSFPCTLNSAFDIEFIHSTYGANASTNSNCPTNGASIKTAFSSYFSTFIPQDPYCTSSCLIISGSNWKDYDLYVPADGSSFMLYTELENAPSSMPCTTKSPWNYCVQNQL